MFGRVKWKNAGVPACCSRDLGRAAFRICYCAVCCGSEPPKVLCSASFTFWAGTPAIVIFSSVKDLLTTALAPIVIPFAILMFPNSFAPGPIHTWSPIVGTSNWSWFCPILTPWWMSQFAPIFALLLTTSSPKWLILKPGPKTLIGMSKPSFNPFSYEDTGRCASTSLHWYSRSTHASSGIFDISIRSRQNIWAAFAWKPLKPFYPVPDNTAILLSKSQYHLLFHYITIKTPIFNHFP